MHETTGIAELSTARHNSGEPYIADRARDPADDAERMARYHFAARYAPSRRVLDVACGAGYGSKILAEAAPSSLITGIDRSDSAIKYAQIHHPAPNLSYMVADTPDLPFDQERFDLVVAFDLAEDKSFLRELKRVLQPDGQSILSTTNRWTTVAHNRPDSNELGDNAFVSLLREHFAHVTPYYQSNVLASVLRSASSLQGLKQDAPCFTALLDEPFNPAAVMHLVAVCSDQPLDDAIRALQADVCLTRHHGPHTFRNHLDGRNRFPQQESERVDRSEGLLQTLRTQVQLLDQRLFERERQTASLEAQIAIQRAAQELSTATIERLVRDLDRTMRECRTTVEALAPIVQQKPGDQPAPRSKRSTIRGTPGWR